MDVRIINPDGRNARLSQQVNQLLQTYASPPTIIDRMLIMFNRMFLYTDDMEMLFCRMYQYHR